MLIADILGHTVNAEKEKEDAYDEARKYEYLTCLAGSAAQFDRMIQEEPGRTKSLNRITRNRFIYVGYFNKENQIDLLEIYQLEVDVVRMEAERQMADSRNNISHVGLSASWVKENGTKVYSKDETSSVK